MEVAPHVVGAQRRIDEQVNAPGLGAGPVAPNHLGHQRGDVDGGHIEAQLASVDAREVEQVIDEPEEAPGVALDAREELPLGQCELGRQPVFDGDQDEGERRAQLVGDVGEELALQGVDALEPLERRGELGGAFGDALVELDVGLEYLVRPPLDLFERPGEPHGLLVEDDVLRGREATGVEPGTEEESGHREVERRVPRHAHVAQSRDEERSATGDQGPHEASPAQRRAALPVEHVPAAVGAVHLTLQLGDSGLGQPPYRGEGREVRHSNPAWVAGALGPRPAVAQGEIGRAGVLDGEAADAIERMGILDGLAKGRQRGPDAAEQPEHVPQRFGGDEAPGGLLGELLVAGGLDDLLEEELEELHRDEVARVLHVLQRQGQLVGALPQAFDGRPPVRLLEVQQEGAQEPGADLGEIPTAARGFGAGSHFRVPSVTKTMANLSVSAAARASR